MNDGPIHPTDLFQQAWNAVGQHAAQARPARAAAPPAIGKYQVEETINEKGGEGLVFVARDPLSERRVAIKTPRFDAAPEAEQRFRHEFQELAKYYHQNIIRVFDIDTFQWNGQQRFFYAMELVEGAPNIYHHSRDVESVAEKIQLFAQACDAVNCIHQNQVAHLDIKPDNLLVSIINGRPQVKLTDFGLAMRRKLVESAEEKEDELYIGGTLRYSSPEQAKHIAARLKRMRLEHDPAATWVPSSLPPLSLNSDQYSLGVVLFEMIVGEHPYPNAFEGGNESAAEFVAGHATVPLIGARIPRLAGSDLEKIIARATQRDPAQRYPSVVDLQRDLQSYLTGEPLAQDAGNPLVVVPYFARRNPLICGLGAGAIVLASVLAAVWWHLAGVAAEERDLAKKERDRSDVLLTDARELIDQLALQMQDVTRVPGAQVLGKKMQEELLRNAERFAKDAAHDPRWNALRAQCLLSVALLRSQGGEIKQGAADYEQATELLEQLCRDNPQNDSYALDLARGLNNRGAILIKLNRIDEALPIFQKAHALRQKLLAAKPADFRRRCDAAATMCNLGLALVDSGKVDEGLGFVQQALREQLELAADGKQAKEHPRLIWEIGISQTALAHRWAEAGNRAKANQALRAALEFRQRFAQDHPQELEAAIGLATAKYHLAEAARQEGSLDEAYQLGKETENDIQTLVKRWPEDIPHEGWVLTLEVKLLGARVAKARGRADGGLSYVKGGERIAAMFEATYLDDAAARRAVADWYHVYSEILLDSGDLVEARRKVERSMFHLTELLRLDPLSLMDRQKLVIAELHSSKIFAAEKNYSQAIAAADKGLADVAWFLERQPESPNWRERRAALIALRAYYSRKWGKAVDAATDFRAACLEFEALAKNPNAELRIHSFAAEARIGWADALLAIGQKAEALRWIDEGIDRVTKFPALYGSAEDRRSILDRYQKLREKAASAGAAAE